MSRRERVVALMREAQASLVRGFEEVDERGRFVNHSWQRPGGGGGTARVLEGGAVFERAGVNVSAVHGARVPQSLAAQHPDAQGRPFFATGVSLVLHPVNPFVPAFHANFRYFEAGEETDAHAPWWFGGGADMTPSYPFAEDAVHFHRTLQTLCARHDVADYDAWKAVCDEYFTIRHRGEMRGVGGIFFDEVRPPRAAGAAASPGADDPTGGFEAQASFVQDGLASLLSSYLPIVRRRMGTPYGERQRDWQLYRRGRYVEFNLVYDRGTVFGLQTGGNIEAILMSMPPLARWQFDLQPEPGSPEAEAVGFYQPRDWVGEEARRLAGRALGGADTTPGAPETRKDG